jgi:hypothetical protein
MSTYIVLIQATQKAFARAGNVAIRMKRPQVMPIYTVQNLLDMEMHLFRKQTKKLYLTG